MGFQTRVFPTFFGKGPDCVADAFGTVLVGALNRPRKRKRTNRENPRTIPEKNGKIPEKSGKDQKGPKRTKKDKKEGQVQIGNPSRLQPPRLAALENSEQNSGKTRGENSMKIRGTFVLSVKCFVRAQCVWVCGGGGLWLGVRSQICSPNSID